MLLGQLKNKNRNIYKYLLIKLKNMHYTHIYLTTCMYRPIAIDPHVLDLMAV